MESTEGASGTGLARELQALDRENLLQNYGARELALVRGAGSHVWDAEGNRYLDCVTGVAVNAFGHGFPPVLEAVRGQLERYLHLSNNYLMEPQQRLAALLKRCAGYDRIFFCNSGTEANEGAIKFARKHWVAQGKPERYEVVSFASSFHGRTYASMAATGQDKIRQGFGPLPPGFTTVPVNDPEALAGAISDRTAAILFEPVLAEGGVIDLSPGLVRALADAQAKGVLLIADEIQAGLGRCGAFLAAADMGLRADLTTLAKPLGGGLPLGAVLLSGAVAASIQAGEHGSTFGGNPVACAAGLAVVGELARPGIMEEIRARGEALRAELARVLQGRKECGPLRGRGLLIGFAYAGDLAKLTAECRRRGLLIYKAGAGVVRLLPPLNIAPDEVRAVAAILGEALAVLGPGA